MSEEPAIYRVNRDDKVSPKGDYDEFEASIQRAARAHDELLSRLFGYVPQTPSELVVSREDYTIAMQSVQNDFGLVEGDRDLVLFILEQLSRSPRFMND